MEKIKDYKSGINQYLYYYFIEEFEKEIKKQTEKNDNICLTVEQKQSAIDLIYNKMQLLNNKNNKIVEVVKEFEGLTTSDELGDVAGLLYDKQLKKAYNDYIQDIKSTDFIESQKIIDIFESDMARYKMQSIFNNFLDYELRGKFFEKF